MPFDKESGQIFHETTVRVGKMRCKCSPWQTRRGVKPPALEERHVSRSLQETALRTVLRNLNSLDEDALRPLPLSILERLWSTIRYHHLDSFRVWQLFASTGGLKLDQRSWQAESNCQYHGLKTNIKWVTSTSNHWLTNLTLFDLNCSVDDLMYINELRNLRNLAVQAGDNDRCRLSDSILREWAYSTKRHGTLSYLETIFLADQNVTSWCLQYLEQFPSLDTFCAFRCNFGDRHEVGKRAKQAGWSLDRRNGTFEVALRSFSKDLIQGNDWSHLAYRYAEHRRSAQRSALDNLPHVAFSFGRAGKKSQRLMQRFSVTDSHFFCFERIQDYKRPDTEATSAGTQQAGAAQQDQPAKRRKLKEGKSIALQHIFFDD